MRNIIIEFIGFGAGGFAVMTLITYLFAEDKMFSVVCFIGAMIFALIFMFIGIFMINTEKS